MLTFALTANAQDASVPRPTPRPGADAGPVQKAAPDRADRRAKDDVAKPAEHKPKAEPPPFDLAEAEACEAELKKKRGVAFKLLNPIKEKNGCGAERPLSLTTVGDGVALEGGATARCTIALALDTWMRDTVQPSAKLHLGAKVTALGLGSHYDCRGRNGDPNAKLSEHAFANGIDIARFVLEDKREVGVKAMEDIAAPERAFLAAVRAAACAYFTTVLGPGSDAAHAEHLHFDLASRRNGYRMCQ